MGGEEHDLRVQLLLPFSVKVFAQAAQAGAVTLNFGVAVSDLTVEASARDLLLLAESVLPLLQATQESAALVTTASLALASADDSGVTAAAAAGLEQGGGGAATGDTAAAAVALAPGADVVLQLHVDCSSIKFTLFSDRSDGTRTPVCRGCGGVRGCGGCGCLGVWWVCESVSCV